MASYCTALVVPVSCRRVILRSKDGTPRMDAPSETYTGRSTPTAEPLKQRHGGNLQRYPSVTPSVPKNC